MLLALNPGFQHQKWSVYRFNMTVIEKFHIYRFKKKKKKKIPLLFID